MPQCHIGKYALASTSPSLNVLYKWMRIMKRRRKKTSYRRNWGEEEEKKEKIDLKISTKFLINLLTNA
jgi:transposase